jgi:hypothetical protein
VARRLPLLPPSGEEIQSMSITVTGTVSDQNGVVLQNAKLTLKPVVTGLAPAQFVNSDASGNYSFTIPTQGVYQLTATSAGIVYQNSKLITALTSNLSNVNFIAVASNASNGGNQTY